MTTTYAGVNPGLGHAQECDRVKPSIGIKTLTL
jgi:hypothetical protein